MKTFRTSSTALVRLPLILALCGLLLGCGLLLPYQISDRTTATTSLGPDLTDAQLNQVAAIAAAPSLFALLVYREDLPEERRIVDACSHLNEGSPLPKQTLPIAPDGSAWLRWTKPRYGANIPKPCTAYETGLAFETFYRISADDKEAYLVIAFRGTDSTSDWRDWLTNIHAAFGWKSPQVHDSGYSLNSLIDQIVTELRKSQAGERRVLVYTTGHSLGGALAQHIAYLSPYVSAAFVFNTSPFTDLPQLQETGAAKPKANFKVYRVSHENDVLAFARRLYDHQYGVDAVVQDIRLKFASVSKSESHSMMLLTCNLVTRHTDDSPNRWMTRDSGLRALAGVVDKLPQEPLCTQNLGAR